MPCEQSPQVAILVLNVRARVPNAAMEGWWRLLYRMSNECCVVDWWEWLLILSRWERPVGSCLRHCYAQHVCWLENGKCETDTGTIIDFIT